MGMIKFNSKFEAQEIPDNAHADEDEFPDH